MSLIDIKIFCRDNCQSTQAYLEVLATLWKAFLIWKYSQHYEAFFFLM